MTAFLYTLLYLFIGFINTVIFIRFESDNYVFQIADGFMVFISWILWPLFLLIYLISLPGTIGLTGLTDRFINFIKNFGRKK